MAYSGIVLYNNDKILLQLRDNNKNTKNSNMWGIFGGGIEIGETPEQAAIRELKEELGLEVKKLEPFLNVEFKNEEIFLFKCKIKDISKLKLNEGADIGLFSKEEILNLKNVVPGLKEMISILPN